MIRLYKWCNGEHPDAISLAEFKRPGALLTAILQVRCCTVIANENNFPFAAKSRDYHHFFACKSGLRLWNVLITWCQSKVAYQEKQHDVADCLMMIQVIFEVRLVSLDPRSQSELIYLLLCCHRLQLPNPRRWYQACILRQCQQALSLMKQHLKGFSSRYVHQNLEAVVHVI